MRHHIGLSVRFNAEFIIILEKPRVICTRIFVFDLNDFLKRFMPLTFSDLFRKS